MTEQLAVDCSLGNRTAVDGKILATATRRTVVDDAGDDLLTHSTLTYYQHTQIRGRHLESDVERVIQGGAIAYNLVPLFYVLKL